MRLARHYVQFLRGRSGAPGAYEGQTRRCAAHAGSGTTTSWPCRTKAGGEHLVDAFREIAAPVPIASHADEHRRPLTSDPGMQAASQRGQHWADRLVRQGFDERV